MRFGHGGDLDGLIGRLRAARPEAVAVALVRSYADPTEEQVVASRHRGRARSAGLGGGCGVAWIQGVRADRDPRHWTPISLLTSRDT